MLLEIVSNMSSQLFIHGISIFAAEGFLVKGREFYMGYNDHLTKENVMPEKKRKIFTKRAVKYAIIGGCAGVAIGTIIVIRRDIKDLTAIADNHQTVLDMLIDAE